MSADENTFLPLLASISKSPSTTITATSVWRDALYRFCFKAKLLPKVRVEAFVTNL